MAIERSTEIMLLREQLVRTARTDFLTYCRVIDSEEFYNPNNWHLTLYAGVMQAFYERRLTREFFEELAEDVCPMWFIFTQDYRDMVEQMEPGRVYSAIMINMPPRTGKTRTLTNWSSWALGKNKREQIMTATYNDDLAAEFSKATRGNITREQDGPFDIAYKEIFPASQIQYGSAAAQKWALDGAFSSYNGVGLRGSATGKGATIRLIDDPIKSAEEAFNENALDKLWMWYAGTFASRTSVGMLEIINHTRWSKNDLCGRALALANGDKWFVFKLKAYYEEADEALAPALLPKSMLDDLKITIIPEIFEANFNQEPVDVKGRLYTEIKTYQSIPRGADGMPLFEAIKNYTDTADTGSDYLCSIVYGVYQGQAYILDVIYTKSPMQVTEPQVAKQLYTYKVETADIESNNGGMGFYRAVERILWETYQTRRTSVEPFHQSKNKVARIMSNASFVMSNVYMPQNWRDRFPEFAQAITSYQKEGKNKHDDAPDALTGVAEQLEDTGSIFIGSA